MQQSEANRCPYGKSVLITGASSGIGLSAALGLRDMGFHVYAGSRTPPEESRSKDGSGFIIPIVLDVTNSESILAAVRMTIAAEGTLDILINCAGVGLAASVEDATSEETRWLMDVNLYGTLDMCRAVLPQMRTQGKGLIINTTSLAAFIAIPFQSHYSMSKAALDSLTQSLESEVKSFGIRCILVQPGDTCTGFTNARKYSTAYDKPGSVYEQRMRYAVGVMEENERTGDSAELVAISYLKLVMMENPPFRTTPGGKANRDAVKRWHDLPEAEFRTIIENKYGC